MMIHYGVSAFVAKPKWEDYTIRNYYQRYENASLEEKKELQAENDRLYKKKKKKEKHFQQRLSFVTVPLGIIAIIVGAFFQCKQLEQGLYSGVSLAYAMDI